MFRLGRQNTHGVRVSDRGQGRVVEGTRPPDSHGLDRSHGGAIGASSWTDCVLNYLGRRSGTSAKRVDTCVDWLGRGVARSDRLADHRPPRTFSAMGALLVLVEVGGLKGWASSPSASVAVPISPSGEGFFDPGRGHGRVSACATILSMETPTSDVLEQGGG